MRFSKLEYRFLDSLITDCITFRLTEAESLEYIKTKFKKVNSDIYYERKSKLNRDSATQVWLNHFTRIGFVKHHREQIDIVKKIQSDSLHDYYKAVTLEEKLKLRKDIRLNAKLLSELGLGTPIISSIKAKIELAQKKIQNNNKIEK